MMNTLLLPIMILALTGLAWMQPAEARLYKWVDENGNVTFSQTPPPSVEGKSKPKVETIDLKVVEPSEEGKDAYERMQDRGNVARRDREFAEAEREARERHEASLKRNCEVARQNMRVLKNSTRIKDQDGSLLDEATIRERIRETEEQIRDNCGS